VNLDDPTLVTAPRHRVLRGAFESDAVLTAARTHFIITSSRRRADPGAQQAALADTVAHQPAFIATFAGEADAWLTLSPDVSPFSEESRRIARRRSSTRSSSTACSSRVRCPARRSPRSTQPARWPRSRPVPVRC
jgi:hypothetical protein